MTKSETIAILFIAATFILIAILAACGPMVEQVAANPTETSTTIEFRSSDARAHHYKFIDEGGGKVKFIDRHG